MRKLQSTHGETIAEVLVSTLIGALAVLMLAMAISVSSKMVVNNREIMDQYYLDSNTRAEGVTDPSYSLSTEDGFSVVLVGESASRP